jgi:hypothetical protein
MLLEDLWGRMKDMVNQQKLRTSEELVQQIMESADCIRGNDEMIRRATNSLKCTELCIHNGESHCEQ